MNAFLDALGSFTGWTCAIWLWMDVVRGVCRGRRILAFASTFFFELRPFIIPMAVYSCSWHLHRYHSTVEHAVDVFVLLIVVIVWHISRNDDDRWKRRRRKLAEKITATGSRLTVVPTGVDT